MSSNLSWPNYVIRTLDACEMDKPIGSSPVVESYAKARKVATRLHRSYQARGDDFLIVQIVRRGNDGDHVVYQH